MTESPPSVPGDLTAVDHVLAADDGRAAEHLVDPGDLGGGAGDEAGAGVGDGLAAALAEPLAADLDGVHLELPVALLRHRHVGERSHVVGGVGASQQQLQLGLVKDFSSSLRPGLGS